MTGHMAANDLAWRKSARSGDNGGHCVELAMMPLDVISDDDTESSR